MRAKILAISVMLLGLFVLPLYAQVDFRNTDRGRPILIEDAYPVEFLAFELQGGIQYEKKEAEKEIGFRPEFRFGAHKNLQIGVEMNYASLSDERTTSGGSDTILHALYNINQEGLRIPALTIRLDGGIPAGGLGTDHFHLTTSALATKSIEDLRFHLNLSYTIGPTALEGKGGDIPRYFYGAGFDYAWPLKFIMVMGDVAAKKPIDGKRTELVLEIGTRMQIHPKWVLDMGIGTGVLKEDGSDFVATAGLTYIFGVRSITLQRLDK